MLRYLANGRIRWKNGMRCNTRTNWEFYAVIDGRCGVMLRDGQRPVLQEHMFWVFAPGCAHAWVDDGHHTYHRLSLHFSSVPFPLDELVQQNGGWLARPLAAADITRLLAIAGDLEQHFCAPVIASPLHFQRGLMELALLLLEGHRRAAEPMALTDVASFRVERALTWYTEHLGRNPSVKEVAEVVHVSPSHLRRLFAEVRQASPKELFRRVRLEKAQDLLGRTNLTLDEIARRCGYTTASHFCRDYKAVHRFTPSTWRRRLIDRFTRPLPAGIVPVREFSARPGERRLKA
ncbi:Xylose operon regulatory protein [Lacunisphaera limnophila]|uniref:Xylose operon regulatory protein n=1 Tax=Lacunisphaera limnophila TaxID=1838286 RepID=A0A1D8ASH2_9BACT|nr:AraC family transcriptional regulator [Lacunisphaera limnophila]AOS43851.1 Xylose operon regulatory protein [Lacunisphaera limnophila]